VKTWRKHVICLLLVTLPVSLWAAVPGVCESMAESPTEPAAEYESSSSGHGHHGPDSSTAATFIEADPEPSSHPLDCDCCSDCLEACTMPGATAVQVRPLLTDTSHSALKFTQTQDSQLPNGPDYPSLYRPPISQI